MNSEAILRLAEAIAEDSLRGADEGELLEGLCSRVKQRAKLSRFRG